MLTSDASGNATWQTSAAGASQTYKGSWSSATTYQLGEQVTQPIQIPKDIQLYAKDVVPGEIYNSRYRYLGLTHKFATAGTVNGVQIYVPTGVRPAGGYTVYFQKVGTAPTTKVLPNASVVDGWNNVLFDTGIPIIPDTDYVAAYYIEGVCAWSNNTTPFGQITDNSIIPVYPWTSEYSPDPYTYPTNGKVLGSDNLSFVSTKGHSSRSSLPTGRYVRFTQPANGYFSASEIEVYQKGSTVNIAAGKPVTQSTYFDAVNYPGSFLTDGNLTNIATTAFGSNQWFQIDLGANYTIETISVFAQPIYQGRVKGANLSVRSSTNVIVWTSDQFTGKTGSTTYTSDSDGFNYYIVNGAWSYNIGPLFTSNYDSNLATLYEAKTTTTNNSPTTSLTQWQPILTALINSDGATTVATPDTVTLRDDNGGANFTNLNFGTSERNNKLVLWGSGTDADSTNFYGFGINGGTLRYQVESGSVHRWYSGAKQYVTSKGVRQ